MRPSDQILYAELEEKLNNVIQLLPLIGINNPVSRDCFIRQLIDSVRRIKYITTVRGKTISPLCTLSSNDAFDPIKAASWHIQQNNVDEAFWLIFLLTHFGKNKNSGWGLVKSVYGGVTTPNLWTWTNASANPREIRQWLQQNYQLVRSSGSFGNHRKRESINDNFTGATIESYIEWVRNNNGHERLFQATEGLTPEGNFQRLYDSMNVVFRFGRTAKFDYLTMVGKLGLENIVPGSIYMHGATGPLTGARLLFGGNTTANISIDTLEDYIAYLNQGLDLYFGMQVLEDALCNWQKSPQNYLYFKG